MPIIETLQEKARSGIFSRFTWSGLVFLLALAVVACGKTGYPTPSDQSQAFSWQEAKAVAVGECIAFSGKLAGSYQNFKGLRLELDGLRDPEECPGCPFVADEVTELAPADAGFNPTTGDLGFSYCPRNAQAFRWRMNARNVFNNLANASTLERLLIMNAAE
ncbi:MAG: hypothetical protein LBN33_01295 [Desulfovibrio sp.]|jgi:hypothetical protein|nr:hypothetical protein [Desulfovibrio sp.]